RISASAPSAAPRSTRTRRTASSSPPSSASAVAEMRGRPAGESRGATRFVVFPHLAGSSVAVPGTCLAGQTPWLYFGFAVPDRTGGQIKESAARSRYGLGPRGSLHPLTLTDTT